MKRRTLPRSLRVRQAATCVLTLVLAAAAGHATLAQEDEPGPLERARRGLRDAMRRISIPQSRLTDGPHVRSAFHDVVAGPSQATVRVKSDGRRVAIGGIVGPNGWILTKASRLSEDVSVLLKDGRELEAQVAGIDDAYDLAMLKVEASALPVLDLARDDPTQLGQWVATPGIRKDPLAIGVVSARPRRIPNPRGYLGIRLDNAAKGARVDQVLPDSGAEAAGVLINDVITSVNGKPTPNTPALIREVQQFKPGDTVELKLLRDGKELTLKAKLSERVTGMGPDRGAMQNRMGSSLSRRRGGFPTVITHDTVLQPSECGGPLVDLDGRTIGFNIARGGRTESYAVPTPVVMTLMYDLMSGNLAPPQVAEDDAEASESPVSKEGADGNPFVPRGGNPAGRPPTPVPQKK